MANVIETLAVAITAVTSDVNSRVNSAVRDAQRTLAPLEKPVKVQADTAPLTRSVENATRQVNGWLGSIAQTAAGVFGGIVLANAVSGLVNGVMGIGRAAIGNNAYFQAMQAGMEATFSDGAIAAAKGGAAIASAGAASAAEAARTRRDVNERIQDAMADHAEKIAGIQADILEVSGQNITTRQQQMAGALAELAQATASRISEVRDQIARSNADFADRQQERFAAYQEQITSLAEQHADRRAAIEQQLADLTASFAERQAERQENLQDRLTDLQSSHEERRANILDQLRTGRGGSAIAARRRLNEEDAAYAKQQEKLKAQAAKEEAKAKAQQDKQIRALQVRLAQEEAEYKKQDARLDARYQAEVAKAQKAHNQQVSDLQARIAKENAAYDGQKAKLTADAAEDVARLQATNAKRLAALQEQLDREDKLYARRMRDLGEQSEDVADKAAKAAAKPVIKAYEELSAMIGAGGFLEGTTTEKERADKIIAWARQIALDLPGSVKDALAATQMAGAFNLDITKWLQPAAGAAATFSKPVEQVMRGIGALAAGRGGEAIEMLRDVGINLRNIAGIEFDAQGSLITPLDKAMPLLRQYLVDRYGGALTKMQGTWANVTSNLGDMWDAFVTKVGGPAFEKLNTALRDGMKWLLDPTNAAQINALATAIGEGIGNAFDAVTRTIQWIIAHRETLIGIWQIIQWRAGQIADVFINQVVPAVRDQFIPAILRIVAFIRDNWSTIVPIVAALGAAFVGLAVVGPIIAGIIVSLTAFGATITAAGGALALIVAVLGGPLTIAIAAIMGVIALLVIAWTQNWGDIQGKVKAVWEWMQPVLAGIWAALSVFWTEVAPLFMAAWNNIATTVLTVWQTIWEYLSPAIFGLEQFFRDHWDNIAAIIQGSWLVIQGIVEIAWALLSGYIKIALAILAGDWTTAWAEFQKMAQAVWEGIQKIVIGTMDVLQNEVLLALAAIYKLGKPLFDKIGELFDNFTAKIKEAVDWLGRLWEAFKKIPGVEGALKAILERGITPTPMPPRAGVGTRSSGFSIAPLPTLAVRGGPQPIQINYSAQHAWTGDISEDQRAAIKDEVQLATLQGINRALNASLLTRGA